MPLPILSIAVAAILAVMGGIGAYFLWQWGSAITQGVQQAAPAIGAMVGAVGMVMALLPALMVMVFAMMLINAIASLARW